MRKFWLIAVACMLIGGAPLLADQSLQEVFDLAEDNVGYDKYIELDPEQIYIGDLAIPAGLKVYIDGNGALIQGQPYNFSIYVWASLLDISNCVVVDGYYGIYYDTLSSGNINSNTVVGCSYSGIAVIYQDLSEDVEIWDNIVTDCSIGILVLENWHPRYIGYNTVYAMEQYRYAELCPDWGGGTVEPFEPSLGDQNIDPQFVDKENDNYNLQPISPCIGTGRYEGDRGALPFEPTSIDDDIRKPENFVILNNYPNPFNASTTIKYTLLEPVDVTIEIYDMLGRKIHSQHEGIQPAGKHSIIWNAAEFSSGIYFYKITAGEYEQTEKMTLLK